MSDDLVMSPIWMVIPNYDLESRNSSCSVSGLPVRDGDVGVFRPILPAGFEPEIGFLDVSQSAIEEAARLLGWIPPEEVETDEDLRTKIKEKGVRIMQDGAKIKGLEARIRDLESQLVYAR